MRPPQHGHGCEGVSASSRPLSALSSKQLLPWLVAVAFFMQSLDTTILNTAVPVVSQALEVAPLSMKSVLASYTLSLAVFIPISGWMADRFGTRRVFASVIGLFTLGSFLCGISSDVRLLVACRILQGCGGAMMVPRGPAHPGAHVCQIRAYPRHEFCRHSGSDRPNAGAYRRRSDRRIPPVAIHIFRESAHRNRRSGSGLSASARLSRTEHQSRSTLSGSSSLVPASLCCLMCWRYSATIR
jgi:hypothetical protein